METSDFSALEIEEEQAIGKQNKFDMCINKINGDKMVYKFFITNYY